MEITPDAGNPRKNRDRDLEWAALVTQGRCKAERFMPVSPVILWEPDYAPEEIHPVSMSTTLCARNTRKTA